MATVTPPDARTISQWKATDRRVRHPLHAVRGYIRTYVILEGVGLSLLYITVAFWLGLALDWGMFRAFAFDWIQSLQGLIDTGRADVWLRAFLLAVVVLGLLYVAVRITLMRLFLEFSDKAVALLLERRFPRSLGDRLITAVELADPNKSNKYGFSLPLVEKTIRDAAERVEQVPVRSVFNWARLRRIYILLGFMTVGMYVIVGLGSLGIAALRVSSLNSRLESLKAAQAEEDDADVRAEIAQAEGQLSRWQPRTGVMHFFWTFHNTAAIWFERNVLLGDIYWPRQAYLEILGFRGSKDNRNEMRVGGGEQRQQLRVRAVEWAVSDHDVAGGWRPMRWTDLDRFLSEQELAQANGIEAPSAGWVTGADDEDSPWQDWTIDQIQQQFSNDAVRQSLSAPSRKALDKVFEKLTELAGEPSMARQIRKLEIPDVVVLHARGSTTSIDESFPRGDSNRYVLGMTSTESIRFNVRGLDYSTAYKYITVVPAPSLKDFSVDLNEPAYVYFRIPGTDQKPLKGHKHFTKGVPIKFDATEFTVPYGTDLVLRGELEDGRTLSDVSLAVPKDTKPGMRMPLALGSSFEKGGSKFALSIANVVDTYDFVIEYRDEDNVQNQRRLTIKPKPDDPPSISDFELEAVMRRPKLRPGSLKTNLGEAANTYLITPSATLPMRGTIQDDYSLTDAHWVIGLELTDVELTGEAKKTDPREVPKVDPKTAPKVKIDPAKKPARVVVESTAPLPAFLAWAAEQEKSAVKLADIATAPRFGPLPGAQIKWGKKETELGEFDLLRSLPKLKAQPMQPQLHYFLTLSLSATDNNVERPKGPATVRSGNSFKFFVVSETEFLAQVGDEEEALGEKLEKVYDNLKKSKEMLDEQSRKLIETNPSLEDIRNRISLAHMLVADGANSTRDIYKDVDRIIDQLKLNRVNKEKYDHVFFNIYLPLSNLVGGERADFYQVEDSVKRLRESAEGDKEAARAGNLPIETLTARRTEVLENRQKVDELMIKVNAVLIIMQNVIAEQRVREGLVRTELRQRQAADEWKRLERKEIDDLLKSLLK